MNNLKTSLYKCADEEQIILNRNTMERNFVSKDVCLVRDYKDNRDIISKKEFMKIYNKFSSKILVREDGVYKNFKLITNFLENLRDALNGLKHLLDYQIQFVRHKTNRKVLIYDKKLGEMQTIERYEMYIIVYDKSRRYALYYDGFLSEFISLKIDVIIQKISKLINDIHFSNNQPKEGLNCIQNCVLSPLFSSLIAHECLGHPFEKQTINVKKKSNNLITFVDIPNVYMSEKVPVPYNHDDNGNYSKECKLIDRGVIKRTLYSESGEKNGNYFIGFPKRKGDIRMRNTTICEGKSTITEILRDVSVGFYLKTPGVGRLRNNNFFEVESLLAYRIKNGMITDEVMTNFTVEAYIDDFIKSITKVGNKVEWYGGCCYKNEEKILVGMGSPLISCKLYLKDRRGE